MGEKDKGLRPDFHLGPGLPRGCVLDAYVNVVGVGLADYEKGCHLPLLHCRPASSCSLSEGTGELRRSGLALSNRTFLDDGNVWCLYFHHSRPLTVRGCWANEMWLLQLRNCIFDFIYLLSRLLYRTAQFGTLRHHPWSWNLCVLEVN